MKYLIIILLATFFISCSKQQNCYCNAGNGEYEYVPLSTNVQNSGTIKASGDLEQECELQGAHLKTIYGSKAYCEMQ